MKHLMTVIAVFGLVAALAAPALARGGYGRGAGGAMMGGGAMAGTQGGMSASEREAFRAEKRAQNQAGCPNAGTGLQTRGQGRGQMRAQTPPPAAPAVTPQQ